MKKNTIDTTEVPALTQYCFITLIYTVLDSGPKNTWNADKAVQRTDKTSFSEIIWSDSNFDERLDYSPIIQHASTFFANNYRTIVESMKLTVDIDDNDSTSVDNAVPATSDIPSIAFPRQSPNYRAIAESMTLCGNIEDSDGNSVVNAGKASIDIPSIAFPRLSPARVVNGSPMNEWDSMKYSTDSDDTDISDSSQYSMWHSLLPPLQHHKAQLDTRANTFPRLQLPPGYACQPVASCVSNVYGDDNSIYYDENSLKAAPQYVHQSQFVHNVPDNCQNAANIGFLALQDYRKNFR